MSHFSVSCLVYPPEVSLLTAQAKLRSRLSFSTVFDVSGGIAFTGIKQMLAGPCICKQEL